MEEKINLVSYSDFSNEYKRIEKEIEEEVSDAGIDVSYLYRGAVMDGCDHPIELGIIWPSIGTMSAEDTEEFAKKLLRAVEICKTFKYTGYYIDYFL